MIKITTQKTDADLFGQSKWWGFPDMPDTLDYPEIPVNDDGDEYDDPLTFICQIRCDELAPYDVENLLPHEGMLYFFGALDYFLGNFDAISSPGMGEWDAPYFKVLYAPSCKELHTHKIVCEDGSPFGLPAESIAFSYDSEPEYCTRLLGEPYIDEVREDMPGMISLLQIDESDDWNLRFYDCGMVNFLISKEDLLNRRWQYTKCYLFSF